MVSSKMNRIEESGCMEAVHVITEKKQISATVFDSISFCYIQFRDPKINCNILFKKDRRYILGYQSTSLRNDILYLSLFLYYFIS